MIEYLDFEVEVAGESGGAYSVAVVRSPAGEAHEAMRFPFDAGDLESRLEDIERAVILGRGGAPAYAAGPKDDAVRSFGTALFEALFPGQIRSLYDVSWRVARSQGKGLRLKLRIRPPELSALPWEFLYDPRQDDYVCLSRNTPIVRYQELSQPVEPLAVSLPLRVLAMVANPSDQPQLNTVREKERIEQALGGLKGTIELTWMPGSSWRELQRAIIRGNWHVFHFMGHGAFDANRNEGLVALTDDEGRAHFLDATQLARLLADQDSLRLVVLNSCEGARASQGDVFSSTASILVRRGIPAVLAMQYEITDQASIELTRVFYENVAAGEPVDAALSEARKAISMDMPGSVEWGIPVLFMRSPNGLLFTPIGAPKTGSREAEAVVPSPSTGTQAAKGDQAPAAPVPGPGARPAAPGPRVAAEPQALYRALVEGFSDDELREACFDLNIDYENLAGGTKAGKARELVLFMQRRSRLPELGELIGRLRPGN